MRLKYLFALLVLVLFALPQNAHSQENIDNEEFTEPCQALIDSLLSLIPNSPDSVKASIYKEIGSNVSSYDDKLKYINLSLKYCSETDFSLMAYNYSKIGWVYYMSGDGAKALPYHYKSMELFDKTSNKEEMATAYISIGECYENLNNLDSSFYYYNKGLKGFFESKDTANICYAYQKLGSIYHDMCIYTNALETYQKALDLAVRSKDTLEIANCYYLMGGTISYLSDTLVFSSIDYLKKSVSMFESADIENEQYYVDCKYGAYSDLAEAYINAAKLTGKTEYADSCYMYFKKVGNYNLRIGANTNYVIDRYNYVDYLIFYKKYNSALDELLKLEKYVDDIRSSGNLKYYYKYLYEVYSLIGDYKNALKHYEKYDEYRFANINDSTLNSIKNSEVERTRMIEELKLENAKKLHAAEKQRMHITIISLIGGLFLVSLLVFYIFKALNIKKKANKELSIKNELLAEQKEEIESQRDTIKAQRDEIQASINYARRIQHSMLPPEETVSHIFPDYFLLYKPRDIVSGDFYWVGQFGDNKVCIVADCTGHGVPGGFLSVLGMSNLNHIVKHSVSPDAILNRLREDIMANLRQNDNLHADGQSDGDFNSIFSHNYDGMDAAVYVINEKSMKLSFAGANNPLVLIRDGKVEVVKANKMPVGIYAKLDSFESVDMEIKKGDCLYTFSDGFQDQFGDGTHDKFTAKRLRDLLLEIHQRPMAEQRELLNTIFEEWRGPAENQTDDVLIMGVRV